MKPLPVSPHALRQIYSSSDGILMTLILVAFVFPPLQISFVHPSLLGLPKEPLERDRFQTTRSKLVHLKPACFVLQSPVAYCFFWCTFTRCWAREANWTPLAGQSGASKVLQEFVDLCRAWRGYLCSRGGSCLEELPRGGNECKFFLRGM